MKKIDFRILFSIISILLAAICFISVLIKDNQAGMPVPLKLTFTGEYSYDGENWYPYTEHSDISAFDGPIRVKGHFDTEILEGAILSIFCNHIGVSACLNGVPIYMDAVSEMDKYGKDLMPSMCGKRWENALFPGVTVEDEVEFCFINCHEHGNKSAYQEALSSFFLTPQDNKVLESYLKPYIEPFETVGYALVVVAIMLLGASFSALLLKSKIAVGLFRMGNTTLFAGGYVVLDVMMVFFADELLVVKTYGRILCMMLAVYFVGLVIRDSLNGRGKKVAGIVMNISGIVNVLMLLIAVVGGKLLFDIQFFWGVTQVIICPILIVLCFMKLRKEKQSRLEQAVYICFLVAVLLDMAGVGYTYYSSGNCAKIAFLFLLTEYFVRGVRQVVRDHQASIKNKKLQEELEDSRITVMISQIQPHFLYNSLTSVMDLCDSNPKKAKAAIADFADYLRGNFSILKAEKMISFQTERKHIETYLRLEKLRFGEELAVEYDIQVEDFMIPALCVQPLVENAVKHGLGRKTGGGTVSIHTSETENNYIIRITDDGVGFEEGEYADDGGTRIGLEYIKKRLAMINARLEINSKKGEGTVATIFLLKRRDQDEYYGNR